MLNVYIVFNIITLFQYSFRITLFIVPQISQLTMLPFFYFQLP